MRRSSLEHMNCSVAQTLEIVGDWWSLLIVRDAFFGASRFGDFQRSLGIARNILTERLDWLCEHEVLERRIYQERRVGILQGHRDRFERHPRCWRTGG